MGGVEGAREGRPHARVGVSVMRVVECMGREGAAVRGAGIRLSKWGAERGGPPVRRLACRAHVFGP
jgi:hypothetical protein